MILWGPPGVGKTTLARLMASAFNSEFIALSAVLSGVKDIRDAVARAELTLQQSGRHTILFVDEVHRFNKSQQDAFLPYVERGCSRSSAPRREPVVRGEQRAALAGDGLRPAAARRAELGVLFDRAKAHGLAHVEITPAARDLVVGLADGDARRLINMVEQLATAAQTAQAAHIDEEFVRGTLAKSRRRFDKGGEEFLRPDLGAAQVGARLRPGRGALLVHPHARRRSRSAVSGPAHRAHGDRGHRARGPARAAAGARRLRDLRAAGLPGRRARLAEAVLYVAVAAKSNAAYVAYNSARAWVGEDQTRPVRCTCAMRRPD